MNNERLHIPAFTLMEALVTIVISGFIVIGIYELQTTLFYQQVQQGKRHERKTEVLTLYNALEQDIARSSQLDIDGSQMTCHLHGENVVYHFDQSHILRSTSALRDTFQLGGSTSCYLREIKVEQGELDYLDLSVHTELGQEIPMHFYKPSGIAGLVNDYFQNASR